ncbi:MAG: alpha/beta fold hydrolase [Cyanobacteria bacterium J06642_2]
MKPSILPTATVGHYWNWRDRAIFYVRSGSERSPYPPLLCVHGFGASTDHWRKNIADLSRDFEVWAIDLLGFGRSAKPDLTYSGELWCEQLHDFVRDVIGRPAILIGNSLGGYASLCAAANYSQEAVGLALLNSAGPFSPTSAVESATPSPLQKGVQQATKSLLLQPWASELLFRYTRQRSVIRKTLKKVYCDPAAVTEQLVDDIRRPADDPGAARVFAAVFKSPQGETVDALLQKLQCPLLLLWGEGDPWMNARDRSAKFRQYYPNLTERFFAAGHCPHDEVPHLINPAIRTWAIDLVRRDDNPTESLVEMAG